jgi:flagella basal body P-ring formation protein FlgA
MPLCLVLVLAASLAGARDASPAASAADADVRAAIVESVRSRMGTSAIVELERLVVRGVAPGTRVRAVPDAGSRAGGPARFLLVAQETNGTGRRVGSADAIVRVSATHVRTVGVVERGQVISAHDVAAAFDDVGRVPMLRLPGIEEIVGSVARRECRPGTLLLRAHVEPAALVRSGDEVTTIVRLGRIEVRGRGVAAATAGMGQPVRVVANQRSLRGRVVGAGEVEIQQ